MADPLKEAAEQFCTDFGFTIIYQDSKNFQAEGQGSKFSIELIPDAPGYKLSVEGTSPEMTTKIEGGLTKALEEARPKEEKPKRAAPPAVKNNDPRAIMPTSKGESKDNLEAWRSKQARTFSVAGRDALSAFEVSEQSNKRHLCTQIIDAGRNESIAWGHVRITDPKTGQYREDKVTHERKTFECIKAWEDVNSQVNKWKGKEPLLIGVMVRPGEVEADFPQLNGAAQIKGKPAPLWLLMELKKAWSFADRDATTKAERRAQLKMLNREWRDDQMEIDLEASEAAAVQESIQERA